MSDKNNISFSEEEWIFKKAIMGEQVPLISSTDIGRTCEVAARYLLTVKPKHTLDIIFWRIVFFSLNAKAFLFWLACAFVLASCAIFPRLTEVNGTFVLRYLVAMAPVPFISFIIGELYQKDRNLMEVEKTCCYVPEHIFIARLSLCMLMNALFVLFAGWILHSFCEDLLRMYLWAFISMFLVGAAIVWSMTFLDYASPLLALLAVWVVGGMALTANDKLIACLEHSSYFAIGITLCLSLCLFVSSVLQSTKKIYA